MCILQKFRSRRLVDANMRIEHQRGRAEPVLAVPDIVCGAIVQHRVGNSAYLEVLGGLVDLR